MEFEFENGETWDWQGLSNFLEDGFDASKCLGTGGNQEEDVSFLFDDQMTPIKECGDFPHFVYNSEEIKGPDKCVEPSSMGKRTRVLHFNAQSLDTFACEDVSFAHVTSKDSVSPVEKSSSELSNWVSGCAEGSLSASGGYSSLDESSEAPITGLHRGADTQMNPKEKISSQIDIADIHSKPTLCAPNNPRCPVLTRRNGFKGRKSYLKTPANLASSVAYPFGFLKPCAVHGDVTLEDINQRIRTPPPSKSNQSDDDPASYPTSAFSGKPVVATTVLCTEGGKGKIKILRTRG